MADIEREALARLTILYVEDERILRETVLPMLRDLFREIYIASNGVEGLRLYRRLKPDIVITDIMMPEMDGLTMAEEIRTLDPEVPIIVLSAFNSSENLMRAVNLGVDGFVQKSFSLDDILKPLSKHARLQLQKKELETTNNLLEQYKKVVDAANPVLKTGPRGDIEFVNDAFCLITGYSRRELIGRPVTEFLEPELASNTIKEILREVRRRNSWKGLIRTVSKRGEELYLDAAVVPVRENPRRVREYIALCHDITDFIRSKQALETEKEKFKLLSITDALTGIYNRQEFNSAFRQEAERVNRYGEAVSLIIFDIDFFKKVNDEWGHQTGDKILVSITQIVRRRIRKIDVFARIGGEEFAILMPYTVLDRAGVVAEKLRRIIEMMTSSDEYNREIFTKNYPGEPAPEMHHTVTCSFGVAQMRQNEPMEEFFKRTDDALYEAKRRGRNLVILSGPENEFIPQSDMSKLSEPRKSS